MLYCSDVITSSCAFWGFVDITPLLRVQIFPSENKMGVNKHFQAKLPKLAEF